MPRHELRETGVVSHKRDIYWTSCKQTLGMLRLHASTAYLVPTQILSPPHPSSILLHSACPFGKLFPYHKVRRPSLQLFYGCRRKIRCFLHPDRVHPFQRKLYLQESKKVRQDTPESPRDGPRPYFFIAAALISMDLGITKSRKSTAKPFAFETMFCSAP